MIPEDPLTTIEAYYQTDVEKPKEKKKPKQEENVIIEERKVGNVTVTTEVREPDFYSQCTAEWEAPRKRREKESGIKRDKDERSKKSSTGTRISFD